MASPTNNQNLDSVIKQENIDINDCTPSLLLIPNFATNTSSSSSDYGEGNSSAVGDRKKRKKRGSDAVNSSKKTKLTEIQNSSVVPPGFLAPLHRNAGSPSPVAEEVVVESAVPLSVYYENSYQAVVLAGPPVSRGCRQFWRAGDYEEVTVSNTTRRSAGMDHVRVHPRFLHSNATSHKWALGAFAELLDNALDEAANGATYVHVDVLKNQRDNSFMLLVEDNGGGMDADKMRHCMSLGYSAKSKIANTIGQYGNGFKTSSMRLGADVIVFSHCNGDSKTRATLSVGLLSYTFLTATGQEDIVVPMVYFEKKEDGEWAKAGRTAEDWDATFEILLQWSPFATSEEFFHQINLLERQGTRIMIYNLWEDDEDNLELDFDANPHDIQIRGINKDEKTIKMANQFPSAWHFLTYKHSLRSYAAILYMKLPAGFKILLRGKEIEHHNIVDDMKMVQDITYKPVVNTSEGNKTKNLKDMVATGKIGFVKDADHHIEVQGFNVYHKNRLIKPFWRVWNAAGSNGRGVIGAIEANFIEPAHDKQGFERTNSLSRLENRLVVIQKNYWSTKCHEIGYSARRGSKNRDSSGAAGCSRKAAESSSANGIHTSSTNGAATSHQFSTPESQRSPFLNPVILTPQGPSCQFSSSTNIDLTKFPSPEPVLSTSGNRRNLQIPPHLRAGFTNSKACNVERNLKETVDGLMRTLQLERDIKQKLESQLQEKIKELETEKLKAEKLEKDNVALIDLLQNERSTWAQKEKVLNNELQSVLKDGKPKD